MAKAYLLKPQPISLANQLRDLRKKCANMIDNAWISNGVLTCIMWFKPTIHSRQYKIKIVYKLKKNPHAWLIFPQAEKYNDNYPHHKYGFDEKRHLELCFFDPKGYEWSSQNFIADLVVPWISTWLFAYEYWLVTGKWVYPESNRSKN
jgi:hypothetical protein